MGFFFSNFLGWQLVCLDLITLDGFFFHKYLSLLSLICCFMLVNYSIFEGIPKFVNSNALSKFLLFIF